MASRECECSSFPRQTPGDAVWVRIAAANSREEAILAADFVCTGTWRGNIGFTRQPKWNAINSVDEPIWAEDGSGAGFVTRNNAHKPACGTDERRSYYPQYMQQVYDTDLDKLLICTDPAKRVWRDAMGKIVE